MRLTKKMADNGRCYLSGLAEVSNYYPKGYGRIQVGHAVEKLAEYEDLEEQGKLLKLPCTVGDIVYSFSLDRIITLRVDNIIVFENGIDIRVVGATEEDKHIRINLDIEEFCQKCFPTREEVVFKILKI